ncbi:hypothetical protein PCYB_006830 [Plasmodium cynomolgi strain B]|uniref:CYIR protein n=1 Tax=Plasmodium cynomolgi (strain B) TaxID=1120755 RepID=K6V0S1_PLACD|nr:hypothetical protein PCYB_006830 [Plasmodium cynomolgi strain B]GAB69934.1 hypothetical protein PCYB_006830 [Plasmodium cynomolgi strain B]
MDFSQLKQKYPFLEKILNLHDELDQHVDENDNDNGILKICDQAVSLQSNNKGEYKKFCTKHLRNLYLCKDFNRDKSINCCSNLDVWLYFEIKKKSLSNSIIEQIFNELVIIIKDVLKNTYCSYLYFSEKIYEIEELVILSIFNENYKAFRSILKNEGSNYYCSCRNFVIDCINIYNTIKIKYCSTAFGKSGNNIGTCNILDKFFLYYTEEIYSDIGKQAKLPDLSSTIDINIKTDECPLQRNNNELGSVNGDQSDISRSSTVSITLTEPTRKTVPVALGTIAGVSSTLALLYKVITNFYLNI